MNDQAKTRELIQNYLEPLPAEDVHELATVLSDASAVPLRIWSQRPTTVVLLRGIWRGHIFDAIGWSKVCYPDEWDKTVGIAHATLRAHNQLRKRIREVMHLSHAVGVRMTPHAYDKFIASFADYHDEQHDPINPSGFARERNDDPAYINALLDEAAQEDAQAELQGLGLVPTGTRPTSYRDIGPLLVTALVMLGMASGFVLGFLSH